MRLTSFLREYREIRTALLQSFPFPCRQDRFPTLKAPPQTNNYLLMGQAFDYLLRFYIQRHNSSAPKQSHWVADCVYAELDEENIFYGAFPREQEQAAQPFLDKAHEHHET